MRPFLFAALLALASAFAPLASAQAYLTPAERLLAGVAGATAGTFVLVAADGHSPALAIPASPLVAGLVVYGLGKVFDADGRLAPTLVGAGLGTLPAILLLGIAEGASSRGGVITEADLMRILAGLAYVVGPPAGAVLGFEGFDAGPVALSHPEGGRSVGLALRVGL
jgi:hypothetical protein